MNPNADPNIRRLDQSEIRTQQALGPLLLTAAYILDDWRLVAAQGVVFLITALRYEHGPYVLLYRKLLKPLGLVKPDIRADNPEPHRFATLFGLTVLAIAVALLATGEAAGWLLVGALAVFGGVAFFGWCAGCFFYYFINRLGAGGFFRYAPIGGTAFPGARPPKSAGN